MIPVAQIRGFELEKRAILGTLLLGGGLHLGANAAYKGFLGSHAGHEFEARQLASGFRHGVGAQNISPVARNIATYGLGPESLVNYDIGRGLGGQMTELSKGQKYRQLKKLRKNVAMSQYVKEAPVGRSVVPAVNRILSGQRGIMDKIPTVAAGAPTTIGQKLLSGGLGAAAIAAEPHTAIHMGINAARRGIATSSVGKKFMKNQFMAGLSGEAVPKSVGNIVDLAVSPAALNTNRLGAAMAQEYATNPQLAARLGKSFGGQVARMPGIQNAALGAGNKAMNKVLSLPREQLLSQGRNLARRIAPAIL